MGECRSGIGTTISFGTATTYEPKVRSINGLSIEREMFDCTHMGSAESVTYPGLIFREYRPGDLAMAGQLTLGILWDPDEAPDVPINTIPEVITISWKPIFVGGTIQGTPASLVFTGFIISYSTDIDYEGLMEGNVVVQPTGDMVFTAGVV